MNLPPFREIDSARALNQEEDLRSDERFKRGERRQPITSPHLRRLRSCSRSSSRSNSATSMSGNSYASSSIISTSSLASHDSASSFSSAFSSNDASTPIFRSMPDHYSSDSSVSVDEALGHPASTTASAALRTPSQDGQKSRSRTSDRISNDRVSSSPIQSPPPSFPMHNSSSVKKTKTVWIIRTLEPRKMGTKRKAVATGNNSDEEYDFEPQKIKTHVETHVLP